MAAMYWRALRQVQVLFAVTAAEYEDAAKYRQESLLFVHA